MSGISSMQLLRQLREHRCVIGEGPIWNERTQSLYYTDGGGKALCIWHMPTETLQVRPLSMDVAAIAFTARDEMLISRTDGVFLLHEDDTVTSLYDPARYTIRYANDMKVGPDGALYVGTQSERRMGLSDHVDGKLYRIDPDGTVTTLLEGLLLSNGMAWSPDGTLFYHTDSDTDQLREYTFHEGQIAYTGRQLTVSGIDGFTMDDKGLLYIGCWGQGHIAIVDTESMTLVDTVKTPCRIPPSCTFCGENRDILAVTSASFDTDRTTDPDAGFSCLYQTNTTAPLPYRFG